MSFVVRHDSPRFSVIVSLSVSRSISASQTSETKPFIYSYLLIVDELVMDDTAWQVLCRHCLHTSALQVMAKFL